MTENDHKAPKSRSPPFPFPPKLASSYIPRRYEYTTRHITSILDLSNRDGTARDTYEAPFPSAVDIPHPRYIHLKQPPPPSPPPTSRLRPQQVASRRRLLRRRLHVDGLHEQGRLIGVLV